MAPFCLRDHLRRNKRFKLPIKNKKRKSAVKSMQKRFERLKTHMEEVSEDQKIVRGLMRLRDKFEAIGRECEGLKRETRLIIKQSARNQIKLAIMFRILKAREQADFSTAANLTQALRAIVRLENEENEASDEENEASDDN